MLKINRLKIIGIVMGIFFAVNVMAEGVHESKIGKVMNKYRCSVVKYFHVDETGSRDRYTEVTRYESVKDGRSGLCHFFGS